MGTVVYLIEQSVHVDKGSHGFLQHLTQFKLFLVFLQFLNSMKFLGSQTVQSIPATGFMHFSIFVVWSIFINTIMKKVAICFGLLN